MPRAVVLTLVEERFLTLLRQMLASELPQNTPLDSLCERFIDTENQNRVMKLHIARQGPGVYLVRIYRRV